MNIGHSSRLTYDSCAYDDRLEESTGPYRARVDPNRIKNCESCLSVYGPRGSHNGYGVSTVSGNTIAPSQDAVDVESILTNRNVPTSKCKDGKVNKIDVTKFGVKHARVCNKYLDPVATRLTNPVKTYREMAINRFHDLPKDPQMNVFYDFSRNTVLEAKDGHKERIPHIIDPYLVHPREVNDDVLGCMTKDTCPFKH